MLSYIRYHDIEILDFCEIRRSFHLVKFDELPQILQRHSTITMRNLGEHF